MLKPFSFKKKSAVNKQQSAAKKSSPVCFIHIPKTAGTSFRKAAEQYWGTRQVLKNYGKNSPETSVDLRQLSNDPYALRLLADRLVPAMYTGHIHAKSCYHLFPAQQFVSFIRNPETQVLSHYRHAKRWNGFEGDLQAFVLNGGARNVQSKYLSGLPPELMGLVGITECYGQSLELFNQRYDVELEGLEENINDYHLEEVSNEVLGLIYQHNRQDFTLYERSLADHHQRWDLYQRGEPWVHGVIGHLAENRIGGWAFFDKELTPVKLNVFVNNQNVGEVVAQEYRPHLSQFDAPRAGYVGYSLTYPLSVGDTVKVTVKETGQELRSRIYQPQ